MARHQTSFWCHHSHNTPMKYVYTPSLAAAAALLNIQVYKQAEKCDYGRPPFSTNPGSLPPAQGDEFNLDDYMKLGVAVGLCAHATYCTLCVGGAGRGLVFASCDRATCFVICGTRLQAN